MVKMNAGYHILKEEIYDVAEGIHGIALGYRATPHTEYVTWGFTQTEKDISYYWGHYFNDWAKAYKDYHERLASEYARMEG